MFLSNMGHPFKKVWNPSKTLNAAGILEAPARL
jgi:hypothetical protein